jgi:hypothetical protein
MPVGGIFMSEHAMVERIIQLNRYEIGIGLPDGSDPTVAIAVRVTLDDEVIVLEMTPDEALALALDLVGAYKECRGE